MDTKDNGHFKRDRDMKKLEKVKIVRCKDCKHRPIKPEDYENGFDLEFPDRKCPCYCEGDEFFSWYPADDWYCACGEGRSL